MFFRREPEKTAAFWGTTPIRRRMEAGRRALHIPAEEADGPPGAVVEPGDEVCQGWTFPEPVPPMTPMVSPGMAAKVTPWRASCPARGVGEVHVLKGDGGNGAVGSGGDVLSGLRDGGGCVEDGR